MVLRIVGVSLAVLFLATSIFAQLRRGYDLARPGMSVYAAMDSTTIAGGTEKLSRRIIPVYGFSTFGIFIKYDTTTGTGIDARTFVELSHDGKNFDLGIPVDTTDVSENSLRVFKNKSLDIPNWAVFARAKVINDAGTSVQTGVQVQWLISHQADDILIR